ncbi:efflux RND transporter periplasmic adaptor subunit [Chitinophaga skermanii]|nr:efflux RND transporter periplasmic adaptor subunit [Chitinophaga skermanii]
MKRNAIIYFVLPAFLLFGACQSTPSKEMKEEEAQHEEHENPNTTTLTAEQIKSIGIETGHIEEKQLTASLKATGVLQVPNQNKAHINSLYSGVVQTLLIQPGNIVKKGQVIATLANPSFLQTQEEYISLASRINLAELEFNRQKELNEGNAGALKNLQAAETELKNLRTRRNALTQSLQLMGINPAQLTNGKLQTVLAVRSPIGGVVSSVTVKLGTYVDVTTPIAEVVDNSQLHLDLFVYEKDLPKLKNNQIIHFTLTNNPGKEYDAEIYSLGSSFEGESKAINVHSRVKGDKTGLIDGMNVTAVVSLNQVTVPAVPSDAIVTFQGQDYIFVVTDPHKEDEHHDAKKEDHDHSAEPHDHDHAPTAPAAGTSVTFEKIPVAKGTSDVGYTEITLLKNIPADAKIVVKGAFFVLAKMNNTGEEGHPH